MAGGRSKTRFAVLGLLSWRPLSGYDIKKLVEMGLAHFWNESYGALYPTLKGLVAEGLARQSEDRRGAKRQRHRYSITARGRRELEAWLRQPASAPRVRNEMLLKLFLGSASSVPGTIRHLEEYAREQRAQLGDFAESERILRRAVRERAWPPELEAILGGSGAAGYSHERRRERLVMFLLTLRHGILANEARLAWCEDALPALRQLVSERGEAPDRASRQKRGRGR